MVDDVRISTQTRTVLAALLETPSDWQYGYDLSRRTDLKSGTLYPLLMRLSEREWLETKWELAKENGKPRHMYRLTSEGRKRARTAIQEVASVPKTLQPIHAR